MKALSFNGVTLTPIHHNAQIYLTSAELAKALGYASLKSVNNLYNANADEFSADMTTVIDSMTVRKTGTVNLTVRIFSLRGCHLIAMFARTPVAKEFRKWVLDILDKEVGEPVITPINPQPAQSSKLSPSDYDIVRRAVQHISIGMYLPGVSASTIHARLRHLCGVDSVCELRYEHLPLIQNELYRIERTLAPYKKMRLETEKQLIRRICGDDEFAVSAAILDIEKTATAYAKAGDKCLSATLQIKQIGQIGGAM